MIYKKKSYTFKINDNENFDVFNDKGNLTFIQNKGIPMLPLTSKAVIWGKPKIKIEEENESDEISRGFTYLYKKRLCKVL